jgi:AraC family transcriptional regulator
VSSSVLRVDNLTAGQFYGRVPNKRVVASSIMSEVIHHGAVDVPAHSHELAYFTLVLGGDYSERFGSINMEHHPMSILWHRAGISHKDRIGNSGGRFFTVEIKADGIDNLRRFSAVPEDFTESGTPLVWLAARLFTEFKNWQDCSELIAEGLTLEMLGLSARSRPAAERTVPKWLESVVDRLNDEFRENPATDDLAAAANVHPVHLAAVFRRFHGQTIGEYLQNLRVRHASKLIVENKLPLADVAAESGFADQSHLTRTFKRITGMTPGAFRMSLS